MPDVPKDLINAKIVKTELGIEDHGILHFYLFMEWESSYQGFGGWSLDGHNKQYNEREGSAEGMALIRRILEVVGVDCWERLVGNHVRLDKNTGEDGARGGLMSTIEGIWHITKSESVYPRRWFAEKKWMNHA